MIKIFLFKVEMIGQGLVVVPGIPLEYYEGSTDIKLLLKKPDGSHFIEKAEIFYSFLFQHLLKNAYCIISYVKKRGSANRNRDLVCF